MTTEEFSNEFDILYNNVTSNQAPPLDEYEKSVFLTRAQEGLVLNYFMPETDPKKRGFDGTQERQMDYSSLVKIIEITDINKGTVLNDKAYRVVLKKDYSILLILSEIAVTDKRSFRDVKPLSYTEYNRQNNKPYKYPLKNQAWRIITGEESGNISLDILMRPQESLSKYVLRYVKSPNPIILKDLDMENLSINNQNKKTECELNPIIHMEILETAVNLANSSYKTPVSQGQPKQ